MKLNEESILQVLDSIYDNVISGLPGSDTVYELAEKYLEEHHDPQFAAESLIRWQTAKCATSGFLSGLGGILSLPLILPADIAATYYIQMRMIASIALINGYDIKSTQVKSFIYCSLLGDDTHKVLNLAGLKLGKQFTKKAVTSMSPAFISKVNMVVKKGLISRFRRKGLIHFSKFIPLAGGILGAGVNAYTCYEVARSAQLLFPSSEDEYSIAG